MIQPPLLALAAGRRVRPRQTPKYRPKEIELHIPLADLLRRFAKPDWKWAHYPAGEHRDIRTAQKLKAMGVQRGWPDFVLFDPSGRLHALELKRQGNNLTEDQEDFQTWCITHAVPHAVAWSFDEALNVLTAWGALRVSIGGGA